MSASASAPASASLDHGLAVTTWNLGYAGLGRGSDFVVDGGRSWLPPSRRAVRSNAQAIAGWLQSHPRHVLLAQEVARAGPANYWVDLDGALRRAMPSSSYVFQRDVRGWLPLTPFDVCHGLASVAEGQIEEAGVWPLPRDGDISTGWLRKDYAALTIGLAGVDKARPWLIGNVHLAAFDPGARLRRRQLDHLLDLAQAAHASGASVVLGGDWNMRLSDVSFPHQTPARDLEWLADFPSTALPSGWRTACDASVPSVRSNNQPYVAGENFTTVIDGFIVSPDVEVLSVQCADLGFAHSDHHPVTGVFRQAARP